MFTHINTAAYKKYDCLEEDWFGSTLATVHSLEVNEDVFGCSLLTGKTASSLFDLVVNAVETDSGTMPLMSQICRLKNNQLTPADIILKSLLLASREYENKVSFCN